MPEIPTTVVSDFVFGPDSPLLFAAAMGEGAAGAVVVRFDDPVDHRLNRELASSLLSTLGALACVYPHTGLWSDLGVKLDADPMRTHGVGENPFHMDLVDRDAAPRYIALYCERKDPAGGGVSRLSDVWAAIEQLDPDSRRALASEAFSYFTDEGVHGVGVPMDRFSIVPRTVTAGVPVRFTSKMLPHLQRGELVEHDLLDPKVAAAAFEELTHAVNVSPIEHLLEPGDLLVFDQYRWAHSRAPLGGGQAELAPASRRLLKQAYVRPEVR